MPLSRHIVVPVTTVGVLVSSNPEAVSGWSFVETTGTAAASMQLVDGQVNTGDVLAEITLDPGASIRDTTGPWCLEAGRGVFVAVLSGSVRGTVWAARLPEG